MTILNESNFYSSIIVDALFNRTRCNSPNFKNYFTLRLKIDDDSWTDARYIDYKIASLVTSLQKDVIGCYNIIANTNYSIKNIHRIDPEFILKVKIEDGCIQAIADLANFFKAACNNMTGPQRLAAIGIVCGALVTGYVGYEYIDYLKEESSRRIELESKKIDENTKIALMKNLNEAHTLAIESLSNNIKTYKTISENISDSGIVSIGSKNELSKQDLNKIVCRFNVQIKKEKVIGCNQINIDNTFDVIETKHEKQTLVLRYKDNVFEASTLSINSKIRKDIVDRINDEDINNHSFATIPLNIVAEIRNGKISNAFIVGNGEPREDSVDIATLLSSRTSHIENDTQKQAELPNHILFSSGRGLPPALSE